MRTSKRNPIISAVIIVLMVALCLQVTYLVLSPYGQKSELVWSEFRQEQALDAVCLGSSVSAHAYDPAIVDSICDTSSFNMSTPSQRVSDSYLGLREAIEHHKIKRVFYGVDFSNFIDKSNLNPVRTFDYEKWRGDWPLEQCADIAYLMKDTDCMFDERSINWLFPWTESHPTDGAQGIIRNVRMRLNDTSIIEAAELNDKKWHYHGKGYGNYTTVLDYNTATYRNFVDVEGVGKHPINERELTRLGELADLCAENEIEFIAFIPALPDFSLISLRSYYADYTGRFQKVVEEHGGSFYDFNLADPSFYKSEEDHFEDYQHYNVEGAKAFSAAFAKLVQARENGEDVSSWFTTYEKRLADIDHISIVCIYPWVLSEDPPVTRIEARYFAGTNVQVECRFLVKAEDEKEYKVIQDWTTEREYDFAPEQSGRYDIRVETRQVGSNEEYERWAEVTAVV